MIAVEPEVRDRYVRAGTVKLVFRAVLNHQERSIRTSEAAACAGRQGHFWLMHDLLFQRQRDVWGTANDDLVARMTSYAQEVPGLDQELFATCMRERLSLEALQAADAQQRRRGIAWQPVFEVNGHRLVGLQSVGAMSAAIM